MPRHPLLSTLLASLLGCLATTSSATAAGVPYLLKDINLTPAQRVKPSSPLFEFKGMKYFWGSTPTTGTELWKTDGTPTGTVLVKDINVGRSSSLFPYYPYSTNPHGFVEYGGHLYFFVTLDGYYLETTTTLWKTDGTEAGTVPVTTVPSRSTELTKIGDSLIFKGESPTGSLWKSDGTAEGTIPFAYGSYSLGIALGDSVFYLKRDPWLNFSLWKSDIDQSTNVSLKDNCEGEEFKILDGSVYFIRKISGARELWKTDGTPAGTLQIAESADHILTDFGGLLYYTDGSSLYRTDGTPGASELIAQIPTNVSATTLAQVAGDYLYFTCSDGQAGKTLWRTDGTAAGTLQLRSASSSELIALGDTLIFSGPDPSIPDPEYYTPNGESLTPNGERYLNMHLWKSDGTPQGTVRLTPSSLAGDTSPFITVPPTNFSIIGNTLYFSGIEFPLNESGPTAWPPIHLWKSDGTASGTTRVELPGGTQDTNIGSFSPSSTEPVNYFVSYPWPDEQELWRTDGTPGGTVPSAIQDLPFLLIEIKEQDGARYYVHYDEESDTCTLSKSDLDEGNLIHLKQTSSGTIRILNSANGTLYFSCKDSAAQIVELWKTDGTPQGTVLIQQVSNLYGIFYPVGTIGDWSFFDIYDDSGNLVLWKTDGTPAGTSMVQTAPINENQTAAWGHYLQIGNVICLGVENRDGGMTLWRTDGTPAGTYPIKEFPPQFYSRLYDHPILPNGVLYFFGRSPQGQVELWKTDGTASGTVRVKTMDSNIAIGNGPLTSGDLLFYITIDFSDLSGEEVWKLWRSDGSEAGTIPVKTFTCNIQTTTPLHAHRGLVFFTADDGIHGEELWRSDGTVEGTYMTGDITGDSGGGCADGIFSAGDRVVFQGITDATGYEPYGYDPTEAPTISTAAPQTITPHGASLRGTVNAGGTTTTVTLEYGTTTSYGSTATVPLVVDNLLVNRGFSLPLAGLTPGTLYHYRYTAVNRLGQAVSETGTFTTQPATPLNLWLEQHDPTGGLAGNPDGDALNNLLEFAFGTDPADASTSSLVEEGGTLLSRGTPILRRTAADTLGIFARRKDRVASGLTYTPQFSTNLTDWIDGTATPDILASDADLEILSTVPPAMPGDESARFFRVKVAAP